VNVATDKRIRVVVAKPGLDGHDVGAKVVCRALMDAGMEVVYTGLRQSPEAIARVVLQEAPDVLGLSILSGAHLPLCEKVAVELHRVGAGSVVWLVGGNVPRQDHAALHALGVAGVFPTSSRLDDVVSFIRQRVPS
jgi:methylmalonyl-CoA mutase C-terminal domain/subunit